MLRPALRVEEEDVVDRQDVSGDYYLIGRHGIQPFIRNDLSSEVLVTVVPDIRQSKSMYWSHIAEPFQYHARGDSAPVGQSQYAPSAQPPIPYVDNLCRWKRNDRLAILEE